MADDLIFIAEENTFMSSDIYADEKKRLELKNISFSSQTISDSPPLLDCLALYSSFSCVTF